jgi:hypothetical protein
LKNNENNNTRIVLLRTGIVLGRDGGVTANMLFPFEFGLGGLILLFSTMILYFSLLYYTILSTILFSLLWFYIILCIVCYFLLNSDLEVWYYYSLLWFYNILI